jgi:isomerase DpgB
MVTGSMNLQPSDLMTTGSTDVATDDILVIDGAESIAAALTTRVERACDRAEAAGRPSRMIIHVSGTSDDSLPDGLTLAQVNRWERTVRRLERLPVATIAVADGTCGGPALDILLAADIRIATASARLAVPVRVGATWPGMALFRLIRLSANAAAARRAALFGEPIDAADALDLHLVDTVTENLASALAAARAAESFVGPEVAIRRQLITEAVTVSYEEALGVHLAACDRELRRLRTDAVR